MQVYRFNSSDVINLYALFVGTVMVISDQKAKVKPGPHYPCLLAVLE